jgi:hypothetical protein
VLKVFFRQSVYHYFLLIEQGHIKSTSRPSPFRRTVLGAGRPSKGAYVARPGNISWIMQDWDRSHCWHEYVPAAAVRLVYCLRIFELRRRQNQGLCSPTRLYWKLSFCWRAHVKLRNLTIATSKIFSSCLSHVLEWCLHQKNPYAMPVFNGVSLKIVLHLVFREQFYFTILIFWQKDNIVIVCYMLITLPQIAPVSSDYLSRFYEYRIRQVCYHVTGATMVSVEHPTPRFL